ncbi:MAG: phosphodiester glycosidase family protein [Thermoleophilia bacterium]
MRRLLLLPTFVALILAAPAVAQPRTLWPGVTYDTAVQFTSNGPVALNVLTGPRPGGTTTLVPALSNETLTGTETLTAMQRRFAGATATATAGVNGDYFSFETGSPSGILMRDGQIASPPSGARSSAGITTDGALDIRRISFFGTWQGAGVKHTLNTLNRPPPPNGTALYTQAWGPETPAFPGATALILFPLPAPVPNADLAAPVVEVRTGGAPVSIPLGGAVLLGIGSAAAVLATEGPVGQQVTSQLIFRPEWPAIVSAIGGGPQIVRNGAAVFRAGEAFTPFQLGTRAPRTGLGQLADGRVILVAVDGRQPGYSVGMTMFELAQTLVRLGAVTAMALDGGGSTTMAFNGTLLNRLSGTERPVSTALLFAYTGVFVDPAAAVVSPDGDGVSDRQSLRYRLVRPATTTVTLTAPGGTVAFTETKERQPGSFQIPFPPSPTVPVSTPDAQPANGRWTLAVAALDEIGQPSEMTQSFTVNTTVGFLSTVPRKLFLPPRGRDIGITWKQPRPARVVVTVETPAGEVVRTLAKRSYRAGSPAVVWNGLDRQKQAVRGGNYVVRVTARNALGTIELTHGLRVQRIVGPR